MALSDLTWTALKAVVADYLAKSNLSTQVPDFIYLAETRLFRRLNLLGFEDVETGTMTSGTATLALPTGHSETRSFYITSGDTIYTVRPKPPHVFFETDGVNDSGTPAIMAVIGSNLHFGPTPDADYAYTHHYVGKPQHLGASQATNWLLTNAPDVYLYASLLEAEPFLKNDPRIAVWRDFLAQAIADLEVEDHESRYSGGVLIPSAG